MLLSKAYRCFTGNLNRRQVGKTEAEVATLDENPGIPPWGKPVGQERTRRIKYSKLPNTTVPALR